MKKGNLSTQAMLGVKSFSIRLFSQGIKSHHDLIAIRQTVTVGILTTGICVVKEYLLIVRKTISVGIGFTGVCLVLLLLDIG